MREFELGDLVRIDVLAHAALQELGMVAPDPCGTVVAVHRRLNHETTYSVAWGVRDLSGLKAHDDVVDGYKRNELAPIDLPKSLSTEDVESWLVS